MTFVWQHTSPQCCEGHPCDGCATCARGRCCRKDCPTYNLPKLGEWDGPLFGELGVLDVDATGEHVQCGLCGQWKRQLGQHLWVAHDRTSAEYRAIWGLRQSTGLAAPVLRDAIRAANSERLRRVRPAVSHFASLTPEQRAAYREQVQWPLEATLDPHYKQARQRAGHLTTARAKRYPCGCGCGALLPPGNGPHRGQRYLPGHVPPSLAERVLTTLVAVAQPLDVSAILAQHPEDHTQVRRALVTLVRRKAVIRTGRGQYQAVP